MMPVMVKEADLDRIGVPEDYEVLREHFKTLLWRSSS
jgi:hypothetical protein